MILHPDSSRHRANVEACDKANFTRRPDIRAEPATAPAAHRGREDRSRCRLGQRLIELVKIRASLLNGCAFCLDMHTRGARKLGETERRIYLLSAWRETDLYSEQERAALALTDAMTLLSQTQDVPDEVYEQSVSVFTEDQYRAVVWTITVINAFNRLGVTSCHKLPPEPQ